VVPLRRHRAFGGLPIPSELLSDLFWVD